MSYLDQLASLSRKKSRDESGRALRGVVDWWRGEGGGSPNRKLRAFADQPLLPTVASAYESLESRGKPSSSTTMNKEDLERCLAVFAFEDWFKKWFFNVLQALEVRLLQRSLSEFELTFTDFSHVSKCRSILSRILVRSLCSTSPTCFATSQNKKATSFGFSSTSLFVLSTRSTVVVSECLLCCDNRVIRNVESHRKPRITSSKFFKPIPE